MYLIESQCMLEGIRIVQGNVTRPTPSSAASGFDDFTFDKSNFEEYWPKLSVIITSN